MHPEAFAFVRRAVSEMDSPRFVVEFGSRDVNGGVRGLFAPDARYCGVDTEPGAGVDVVSDAALFAAPTPPDCVVCCETLEHTPAAADIVANAARILAPGGTLILTAASTARAPHSAVDGGLLRAGEHYRNVDPLDLERWFVRAGLRSWAIETHPRGDVYAVARKARDFAVDPLRTWVVVATLNALNRTRELEAGLRAAAVPLRVLFLDNGSTDGTREWLREIARDGPVCLFNERNLGVAGSWNLGLRHAIANGAEAVLICGHDTAPVGDAIERLVRAVEAGAGLITGTSVPWDRVTTDDAPGDPGTLCDDADLSSFIVSADLIAALRHVETARAAVTDPWDVGLFDTRFFPGYVEDDDFLMRLWRAGLPAHRDPEALFRHDVSAAMRRTPELAASQSAIMARHEALFRHKWGALPARSPARKRRPLNADAAAWARATAGAAVPSHRAEDALEHARRAMGRRWAGAPRVAEPSPSRRPAPTVPAEPMIEAACMRLMLSSNAPWLSTGYGQQIKLLAPRLRRLGHEVAIHCNFGLEGGPMTWDGITCYPKGNHPYGQDLLGAHAAHFRADAIITLFDVWVLDPASYGASVVWAPWLPVDHEPLPERVRAKLVLAGRPIAMSRFGVAMCAAVGIEAGFVPHGIDTNVFRPTDRTAARRAVGVPADAFVVGMVGANRDSPSRKSFPEAFQAFAALRREVPTAVLYVHSEAQPHPNAPSVDLAALAAACGISDAVVFADPYSLAMGCREEHMVDVYNSFDVLLQPSRGEGFGIPLIEAQACGVPVVTGGWTAMTELFGSGWLLPTTDAVKTWTLQQSWVYAPKPESIAAALREAFHGRGDHDARAAAAREFSLAYDVEHVFDRFWKAELAVIADLCRRRR